MELGRKIGYSKPSLGVSISVSVVARSATFRDVPAVENDKVMDLQIKFKVYSPFSFFIFLLLNLLGNFTFSNPFLFLGIKLLYKRCSGQNTHRNLKSPMFTNPPWQKRVRFFSFPLGCEEESSHIICIISFTVLQNF